MHYGLTGRILDIKVIRNTDFPNKKHSRNTVKKLLPIRHSRRKGEEHDN